MRYESVVFPQRAKDRRVQVATPVAWAARRARPLPRLRMEVGHVGR